MVRVRYSFGKVNSTRGDFRAGCSSDAISNVPNFVMRFTRVFSGISSMWGIEIAMRVLEEICEDGTSALSKTVIVAIFGTDCVTIRFSSRTSIGICGVLGNASPTDSLFLDTPVDLLCVASLRVFVRWWG